MINLPAIRHSSLIAVSVLILALLISCSGTPTKQAADRPYHHLDNGRFRNLPGNAEATATTSRMFRFFFNRIGQESPVIPAGHVLPPDQALIDLTNAADGSVTWLGHAAFLLRMGGKSILFDPYLTEVAGPGPFGPRRYAGPGIALDKLPPIDMLIISHNHYDHLDAKTIDALPGKQRISVIAPLKLGKFFLDQGFKSVIELDWYGSADVDGFKVTALPAYHFSRRGLFDRNATLWASYAVEGAGYNIWHSGDTGYGPVFSELGKRYGPFDLAMIAIGAYLPSVIMQPVHLNPEEAVQVAIDMRATASVGMHWGTVSLTEEPAFEPGRRFTAAARAADLDGGSAFTMKIGETRPILRQ